MLMNTEFHKISFKNVKILKKAIKSQFKQKLSFDKSTCNFQNMSRFRMKISDAKLLETNFKRLHLKVSKFKKENLNNLSIQSHN